MVSDTPSTLSRTFTSHTGRLCRARSLELITGNHGGLRYKHAAPESPCFGGTLLQPQASLRPAACRARSHDIAVAGAVRCVARIRAYWEIWHAAVGGILALGRWTSQLASLCMSLLRAVQDGVAGGRPRLCEGGQLGGYHVGRHPAAHIGAEEADAGRSGQPR